MKIPWDQIEELTKYLQDNNLAEISVETKEGKITVRRDSQGVITPSVVSHDTQRTESLLEKSTKELKKDNNVHEVKSPMVGTFYQSSGPGAEPFVQVGSKVKEGTVLCIIEAMKIMNELTSDVSGEVQEILVKDGQTVEYGQVLMKIKIS